MATGFHWRRPPSVISRGLKGWQARAEAALLALGVESAQRMQDHARRHAPWTDRTGNARSGLTGGAEREGKTVTIILAQTVFYGVYLELSNGGRYAIIMPTIEYELPTLMRQLNIILKG